MSGVHSNQSMSDFAKLVEKRNNFIQISLAMDRAVKLYHRYMLSLVLPTERGSKNMARKSSATRGDSGAARKGSSTRRRWDPRRRAGSSANSVPRWNPSSRSTRTRNRFGSSDRSDRKSEDTEYLAMMMEERCQIDIDLSKPFHIQVQTLRSAAAAYSFEDGTRRRSAQEWEGYTCDTDMEE